MTTALTLVNIFPCRPLSASFRITTPPGTYCIDIVALYISTAPINIVTEVAIFFLPMPTLLRMRLPRRQKAILLLTFGTGLFVIVISVLRTEFLLQTAVHRVTKPQPPSVHDLSCRQHFPPFLLLILPLHPLIHHHRLRCIRLFMVNCRTVSWDHVWLRTYVKASGLTSSSTSP